MDPRDNKGDEGVTEAAGDGMAGKQNFGHPHLAQSSLHAI